MSKHVTMMMLDTCPHCREAFRIMDALRQKYPEFTSVELEVVEESREPEKTIGYDYWYVPTFFVDGVKVHEGVPSMTAVERVFREALC